MNQADSGRSLGKVPEVGLIFWVMKIAATTLGETAGDAVTMSMKLGYLTGTAIFAALFIALVAAQMKAKRFHPLLFWSVIIATTTVGTTLADLLDRSLGIGYVGGSLLLATLLALSLGVWRWSCGSVALSAIHSPRAEFFYWSTILFSQTLGTALGDWTADDVGLGLGYGGAAIVFGASLAAVAAGYYFTQLSRSMLFWAAFVLTRPLGATLGDWLDKPLAQGGMALSRYGASAILIGFIVLCLVIFPSRAERTT